METPSVANSPLAPPAPSTHNTPTKKVGCCAEGNKISRSQLITQIAVTAIALVLLICGLILPGWKILAVLGAGIVAVAFVAQAIETCMLVCRKGNATGEDKKAKGGEQPSGGDAASVAADAVAPAKSEEASAGALGDKPVTVVAPPAKCGGCPSGSVPATDAAARGKLDSPPASPRSAVSAASSVRSAHPIYPTMAMPASEGASEASAVAGSPEMLDAASESGVPSKTASASSSIRPRSSSVAEMGSSMTASSIGAAAAVGAEGEKAEKRAPSPITSATGTATSSVAAAAVAAEGEKAAKRAPSPISGTTGTATSSVAAAAVAVAAGAASGKGESPTLEDQEDDTKSDWTEVSNAAKSETPEAAAARSAASAPAAAAASTDSEAADGPANVSALEVKPAPAVLTDQEREGLQAIRDQYAKKGQAKPGKLAIGVYNRLTKDNTFDATNFENALGEKKVKEKATWVKLFTQLSGMLVNKEAVREELKKIVQQ